MIRIFFMGCTSPLKSVNSLYNYTIIHIKYIVYLHMWEITAKSAQSSLVPSPPTPPAKKVGSGDKSR